MLDVSISKAAPFVLKQMLRVHQQALSCKLLELPFPFPFLITSCNDMR